jgi:phasin family protein
MIQQQQTYFLELYRNGMRAASDIMRTSLENMQRIQAQQAEAVRSAIDENVKSTRELAEAKSFDEVVALQSRLLGRQAEMWSRLLRTASETQMAMIGQVQNQVGQIGDTMRQNYASSTRAAEDTARSAASQAGNAANSARESERRERKSA